MPLGTGKGNFFPLYDSVRIFVTFLHEIFGRR
nr:MAG TPA: hypothetical protein [Bacteriophage sp.]